jgi:hypothetical protein
MKNFLMGFPLVAIMLIGCGGDNGNISKKTIEKEPIISSTKTTSMNNIAKDNILKDVDKSFRGYQIKVYTDKSLGDNAVSYDTFALYGKINGENTAALLKLNSNYPQGTKIVVKVYDNNREKLIGESKVVVYHGDIVNFGDIRLH